MGWSLLRIGTTAVNGRVHTLGSSMVNSYMSVSASVRVNFSTRCKFAPEFGKLVSRLKLIVSTSRVWVVRKGATPAFPGQRGFVGGSMGDDAVILSGIESAKSADGLY